MTSLVGLSYPKANHRLERRWTRRNTTVPQRRIYRSRRKGCRCKATYSRTMGLAAPWYHKGRTSVESSIPCSHGGRALVVRGAEEVENAKINSKYQDRTKGQRPRNFITEREGLRVDTKVLDQGMKSFPSSEGSVRTNKDQHNSANPTPDSVIGELKQHGGSEFDYSTTAAESGWESKGHVAAKEED
ncbi:hypothetical protein BHE74_00022459 [Ensete ventricosum]|nr:hypothetical protein BHE74_00022459 [Ensete ventricosum]